MILTKELRLFRYCYLSLGRRICSWVFSDCQKTRRKPNICNTNEKRRQSVSENTILLLCNSLRWLFRTKLLRTKLDIYVFITITEAIPLLPDYTSPRISLTQ